MAKKKRARKKKGSYCVKSGKRTMSCHRLKRVAKKAAKKYSRGRVVKKKC